MYHNWFDQFTVQHLIPNRSVNIESRDSHTHFYYLLSAIWIHIHTHAHVRFRIAFDCILFRYWLVLIFASFTISFTTIVRINQTFDNTRLTHDVIVLLIFIRCNSYTRSNFTITTRYVVEHLLSGLRFHFWITNRPNQLSISHDICLNVVMIEWTIHCGELWGTLSYFCVTDSVRLCDVLFQTTNIPASK